MCLDGNFWLEKINTTNTIVICKFVHTRIYISRLIYLCREEVARFGEIGLSWEEIQCLGPKTALSSKVYKCCDVGMITFSYLETCKVHVLASPGLPFLIV